MLLLLLPLALHLDHELGMVLSGPSVQELQVQVLEVALVYAYLGLVVLPGTLCAQEPGATAGGGPGVGIP